MPSGRMLAWMAAVSVAVVVAFNKYGNKAPAAVRRPA